MAAVRCGRMSRSSTLTAGQRRDMGRYEELLEGGLPGLGRVIMVADFQMEGMSALRIERLKRCVR